MYICVYVYTYIDIYIFLQESLLKSPWGFNSALRSLKFPQMGCEGTPRSHQAKITVYGVRPASSFLLSVREETNVSLGH